MPATLNTPHRLGQEPFRTRAKVALALMDISITDLAAAVGCARVTASECINHGLHEPTRRRIAAHLKIDP